MEEEQYGKQTGVAVSRWTLFVSQNNGSYRALLKDPATNEMCVDGNERPTQFLVSGAQDKHRTERTAVENGGTTVVSSRPGRGAWPSWRLVLPGAWSHVLTRTTISVSTWSTFSEGRSRQSMDVAPPRLFLWYVINRIFLAENTILLPQSPHAGASLAWFKVSPGTFDG